MWGEKQQSVQWNLQHRAWTEETSKLCFESGSSVENQSSSEGFWGGGAVRGKSTFQPFGTHKESVFSRREFLDSRWRAR